MSIHPGRRAHTPSMPNSAANQVAERFHGKRSHNAGRSTIATLALGLAVGAGAGAVAENAFSGPKAEGVACSETEIVGSGNTFYDVADHQAPGANRQAVVHALTEEYREQTGEGPGNIDPATKTQVCIGRASGDVMVRIFPVGQ